MQSSLLVALIGEAHKSVTARLSGRGIRHDLSRLAGGEASLEQRHKNELVHLGAEVSDEDGELGTALVTVYKSQCLTLDRNEIKNVNEPSINQSATRRPVQLEVSAIGSRDRSAIESQGLVGGLRSGELDEAVAGVAEPRLSVIN